MKNGNYSNHDGLPVYNEPRTYLHKRANPKTGFTETLYSELKHIKGWTLIK